MKANGITLFETARLFFWLSILALVVILALWGVGAAVPYAVGWLFGAFTVMGAQLAKQERENQP